jgi:dihydrofolate reductase
MGRLIYSAIASLDGYVADEEGLFDWAAPDEEVHAFVNDLERPIGTYLYGRRMYEVMRFWGTAVAVDDQSPVAQDYAQVWRSADKVVYSTTLASVSTERTRLQQTFDAEEVREVVASAEHDVSIGGPHLAAVAFRAGLVEECHLFLTPVLVGGGTRALPQGVRATLDLVDERRFHSGVVHLRYRTAPQGRLSR